MFDRAQLRKGALEGCILQIIARAPAYGYAIAALLRLERKGLIRAEYRASPSGPSRKYYLLTPAGKTYLAQFIDAWRETSAGVEAILNGGPKGGTPDVL